MRCLVDRPTMKIDIDSEAMTESINLPENILNNQLSALDNNGKRNLDSER